MNDKTTSPLRRLLAALPLLCATLAASAQTAVVWQIDTTRAEQTIRHFGASDAWSMQFVGLWPQAQQEQIADWLFSTDNDATGRPRGIGLSVWRFNLGAGSAEQGDSSQIQPATRTECFLTPQGTYDWTRQPGQRRFLQLARRRGVPHFLAFLNSAPVYFTRNGLATNTGRGGTINLRDDCYDSVARFAATVMRELERREGVHFDYFCPVNEPDGSWNWLGPKQEGSPATNREVVRLARAIGKEFQQQGVSTAVMVDESCDLRCLLGIHDTDWTRGHAIRSFFSPDSTATYLGNTPAVPRIINAHSYWTNTPVAFMRQIREQLRDTLRRYNVAYWQTELCIMSNDNEIGGGAFYDYSMRTALYVARVIHHDLVYGNAESWSWWRALGGDYRDGLIRVLSTDGWRTGKALPGKLMWTLGNYSRFVRPGAVRYDMTARDATGQRVTDGDSDPYGVMVSAYRNTDGRWAVVAINYSEAARPFTLSGVGRRTWKMYRTSDVEGESLTPVGQTDGSTVLEPQSVTTFVAD